MLDGQTAAVRTLGTRRLLAATLAVAAAVVGLVLLPGRFRHVNGEVREFAVLTPQDRHLRAARGIDVDTGIYLLARRVIPPGATYYVTTGPGVGVSTPVTYLGVAAFGLLFLEPRVSVPAPQDAQYVLSYGGDLTKLGVRIGRVWTYKPGLQVAEVVR